jgi:EmrB/QacA subfamily drug resistance transporter
MAPLTATQKRLALVAAIMGSFVAGLDATVVNVALPAIERDLGGGLAGQQWVSNAYLLTLGSLILVGGSLGDLFGERRIFALGVGGFGVVSLGCALSPSIEALIGFRALQGVFGALLTPSALAIIVGVFSGEERGAAIGTWTAWGGISFVIGPLVGGYLIDAANWRWIFAINVPFVLATLGLIFAAIPSLQPGRERVAVDWLGAILCAFGLAGPVFALIQQPDLGWSSPGVLVPGLGGIAIFAVFLLHERRTAHPMLELGLFSRRNFAIGNVQTLAMYAGLSILLFLLVLFLQQVSGYSALEAGLATLPTTVIMFLLSSRTGRLADRIGPRLFMGGGPLLASIGLLLMLRLDADTDYLTELFPALVVFALGLSLTVAPLTATVLADADEHNAGIASGINNAIARVAGLLGIAALGAVVAAQFAGAIDDRVAGAGVPLSAEGRARVQEVKKRNLALIDPAGLPAAEGQRLAVASEDASLHAFRVGMGISAALVALGGIVGAFGIVNPRRVVAAGDCGGGQLAGAPRDAAHWREDSASAGAPELART